MLLPDYRGHNSGRGASPNIWYDLPPDITWDNSVGWFFRDDFVNQPAVAAGSVALYGSYHGFASTGGAGAVSTSLPGGVLTLSSDDDNEGASIAQAMKPFKIDRDQGKFWFEARIRTSTIADTKHGFFLGLIDTATLSATVPLTAAGALADQNLVGFHRLEGDGDYVDTVYKANGVTAVTVKADAGVLAADTWVKLGMKFDPKDFKLRFYRNGTELDDTKTIPTADGTDFPNDVLLGMVFAVLNATGSTPGDSGIDWWQAAQLAV
jgi:hypothetical protein